MPNLPTISLITPSLNHGRFITQTINSVLIQEYSALEYIVADGGSTDETLSILASYQNSLTWSSGIDGGQASAISKGWQNSSGEILGWLNSDDLLRPGALQAVSDVFQTSPETVMVYGECDYLDSTGNIIGQYPTSPWDYFSFLKGASNFLPQPSVFIRRDAIERAGGLDETLHYLMDYDLFLRVGLEGKTQQLPMTLSALRLHLDAKSLRDLNKFGAEMVKVIERILGSDKLPIDFLPYQNEIRRNAYSYAASTCYWSGNIGEARAWLSKCWSQTNWRQIPASLLKLSLLAAAGNPGRHWAERMGKNPFKRMLAA